MSVALAIGRNGVTWIGADSITCAGDECSTRALPKAWVKDNVGYAIAGDDRRAQILYYKFTRPRIKRGRNLDEYFIIDFPEAIHDLFHKYRGAMENCHDDDNNGAVILVGYKGRVYRIDRHFGCFKALAGIATIGVGEDWAMGYADALLHHTTLNPHEVVKKSLEFACTIARQCRPPIVTIQC